jgi:hypothetical protein
MRTKTVYRSKKMSKLLTLLGLVLAGLLALSFAGPALDFARAADALAAAEEEVRQAERVADQAAREFQALQTDERRAGLERATRAVRDSLEACGRARERREAARDRLRSRLGKWAAVFE